MRAHLPARFRWRENGFAKTVYTADGELMQTKLPVITKETFAQQLRELPTPIDLSYVPRRNIQAQLDGWADWIRGIEHDPDSLDGRERYILSLSVVALVHRSNLPPKLKKTYLGWYTYLGLLKK